MHFWLTPIAVVLGVHRVGLLTYSGLLCAGLGDHHPYISHLRHGWSSHIPVEGSVVEPRTWHISRARPTHSKWQRRTGHALCTND